MQQNQNQEIEYLKRVLYAYAETNDKLHNTLARKEKEITQIIEEVNDYRSEVDKYQAACQSAYCLLDYTLEYTKRADVRKALGKHAVSYIVDITRIISYLSGVINPEENEDWAF